MKFKRFSIEVKILAGYCLVLLALVATLSLVMQNQLREKLEQEILRQVEIKGEVIVSELERRTTQVFTLTQSLVNFSLSAGDNAELIEATLPKLIDLQGSRSTIAGGGFWPEPYAFDAKRERRSFFWGRNADGNLQYYDDYNRDNGSGYHHEEWYVPARHLPRGQCYWSRSYTDPYSEQPMVTCTVAAHRQGIFYGAATVDLKLEGLSEFFRQQTKDSGGYAFAVDQHGRFISIPDIPNVALRDGSDYISAEQLANQQPKFKPVAAALRRFGRNLANSSHPQQQKLAKELADSSYQITQRQAAVIAATLSDPLRGARQPSQLLGRIDIDSDLLLNEASTLSIFHVPGAYWKVVVVTPKRVIFSNVNQQIEETLKLLLLPLLLIMALAFIGIRQVVLKPLSGITQALQQSTEKDGFEFKPLNEQRNDEFGKLAYWYNRKNTELNEAMQELSDVNIELSYHANCDALTSLANRREFEQKLQQLIDDECWEKYSLIYIDMDQFKLINDTCGHTAGDQLLIQISQMLRQVIRQGDSVARIGGDEFAVIANTPSRHVVDIVADRILQKLNRMVFHWEGARFNISCSMGVLYLADIDADTTQAMKHVDTACYAAKEAGRNRYHLYQQDDVTCQRAGEMNWIAKINEAFEQNLFVSEFQLIAPSQLKDGQLCAIESLVRIRDAEGKLIPPGAFLPAAERYNAIARIDRWVIHNTLKRLSEHDDVIRNIRFCSINLSGDSLCSEELADYINHTLQEFSIPADKLCFEITETQVMLNINQAREQLEKIRELGCLIALDDFGSGMSSYGYLTELPVKILKIDGYFVRDMNHNHVHLTFVKAMGEIANAMGLETIAEFVEDIDTYHLLAEIGIDYAQGYGIAKPLPLDKVSALLSERLTIDNRDENRH